MADIKQTADQNEYQMGQIGEQYPQYERMAKALSVNKWQSEKQAMFTENPDLPPDEMYNYELAFEQGKLPVIPQEGDDGFQWLPKEFYRSSSGARRFSNYDFKTKTNQYENTTDRMVAQLVKHAYNATFGGFRNRFNAFVGRSFDQAKEDVAGDPMGPPKPVKTFDERMDDEIQNNWSPFKDKITNPAATWSGAAETFGAEAVKIVGDITVGNKILGASNAIKLAKGGPTMDRFAARLSEATSPGVVLGEFLYALDPENKGSLTSSMAKMLEEHWGMAGVAVDELAKLGGTPVDKLAAWMTRGVYYAADELKSVDDTLAGQLAINVIEGALLFEGLRAAYLAGKGMSAPAAKRTKLALENNMKEVATIQRAFHTGIMPGQGSLLSNFDSVMTSKGPMSKDMLEANLQKAKDADLVDTASFKQFGWYRGADGEWRYEVDDSQSKIIKLPEPSGEEMIYGRRAFRPAETMDLPDVIDHPDLFKLYPELKATRVMVLNPASMGTNTIASYDPVSEMITLNQKYIQSGSPHEMSQREVLQTVLHEITHSIQGAEGFALGTNPGAEMITATPRYRSAMDEWNAYLDKWHYQGPRVRVNDDGAIAVTRLGGPRKNAGLAELAVRTNRLTDISNTTGGQIEYLRKYNLESDIYDTYDGIFKNVFGENMLYTEIRSPDQIYRMSAGETEARNVEYRRVMTAEQRGNLSPNMTQEFQNYEQIVNREGGASSSEVTTSSSTKGAK